MIDKGWLSDLILSPPQESLSQHPALLHVSMSSGPDNTDLGTGLSACEMAVTTTPERVPFSSPPHKYQPRSLEREVTSNTRFPGFIMS
eukprot:m.60769 g.60769  ORF g.60769 m.60769 type:complete len:88 (+) comp9526_c0_seq3:1076-1339(+)